MSDSLDKNPDLAHIEELLHSIHPDPGERFHQRMAQTPWKAALSRKNGAFKMNRKYRFAAVAVIGLILIVALAITPAGSALANQILQFFIRAQGSTLPLPPDQVFEAIPTITPEPTHALALQPADQIPQITPTLEPTPAFDPDDFEDMSLMQAEAAVGFDLYQPLRLPGDYKLTRILYDPARRAVSMWYASPQAGSGEFFQITQGKDLEPLKVGADANVETVAIGAAGAEFVRGAWFAGNGADESTWENEAGVYTLRWQVEDVTISLELMMNDSFYPAYLERDEMLAFANDLARCDPAGDYACEVSQAAAAAGFTPWQFPSAPEGYTFQRVDYRPGMTALWYGSGTNQLTVLQSAEDFTARESEIWQQVPQDMVQSLNVAGQPAEYVRGSWITRSGESEAVWDAESPTERLRWKNGEWWFQIVKIGLPALEPQPMADLAGQLTAEEDRVQPERQESAGVENTQPDLYLSLTDLESAAGFDVLEPALTPAGLSFSHARFMPFSGGTMVFYGDFAPDKFHANGPVLIVSQTPRTRIDGDPGEIFPPEAIEPVEVNGRPGRFITGSMLTGMAEPGQPTPAPAWLSNGGELMLTWKTEEYSFTINFNPSGQGARISKQDLLEIAASLH